MEKLIEEARESVKRSKDDGYFLRPNEFLKLIYHAIEDGGQFRLNQSHAGRGCLHEIWYQGIRFISVTNKEMRII